MITLRTLFLTLAIALSGCLVWTPPGSDDDDSGNTVTDDDDSGNAGDDDDDDDDDDDSTPPVDGDGDGVSVDDGDCDDDDDTVYPGAPELCDGIDNDCDVAIDEDLPDVILAPDADGDGYPSGNTALHIVTCGPQDGYAPPVAPYDCADGNAAISPDAIEVCNGLDDNCSGAPDEGVLVDLHVDQDHDGYGAGAIVGQGCPGLGYSVDGSDCDDWNPSLNLDDADGDGLSSCDGDCDDFNPNILPGWDNDGDGYVACDGDCDDLDAYVSPSQPEACNQIDDNCDGQVDEGFSTIGIIHGADLNNLAAIVARLAPTSYCVAPAIDVADVTWETALPYKTLIFTFDTGDATGFYGDLSPFWNWYWAGAGGGTSGPPGSLLAMGAGGMSVLDWLGVQTNLTWANASLQMSGTLYAVSPTHPVWSTPNNIPLNGGAMVLHTQSFAETVALQATGGIQVRAFSNPGGSGAALATSPATIGNSGRDLWLWGSNLPLNLATSNGSNLFMNVVRAAAGPP